MRPVAVLVLGLSLGLMAFSESAGARPRGLSGLFGAITKPFGAILRPPAGIGRRGTHRRSTARKHRQQPVAAETRPATPAPSTQPAAASTIAAGAAGAAAVATTAATAGAAPSTDATATPAAAHLQRSAAVSQPAAESRPRAHGSGRNAPSQTSTAAGPLGVVGPANWPTAFEDILGFTLWPDKYSERLRAHGIGDIMSALFVPAASMASTTRHTTAQAKAEDEARSDAEVAASACADSQVAADWPTRQIEQAMALNDVQRAALDQFRTAVGEAVAAIRAACRSDSPATSAERLQAMQSSLWAVRDATMLVRAPLINFYRSLSDEQKKHFVVAVSGPDPRLAQINQRTTRGRNPSPPQIPREVARMCGMSAANEWPLRQIEQAIQPSKQQKASLDALQKKTTEMGQLLIASCLKPIAAAPEARIDAALDRLTAMLFAITNITLALNDFHGQLNDEQKIKLGPLGL